MEKKYEKRIHELMKTLDREHILELVEKIKQNYPAASAYLVGGTVRDIFLEREETGDFDLVVSGVPAKDLEKLLQGLGEVSLVGKCFGVFKFTPHGSSAHAIDIALPRTEHAFMTGGYHDFDVQSDPLLPIEKDLERRDFTMNAMALELPKRELVDVFGGLRDIQTKIVRCVGDPKVRFAEDSTRMLRAVRFAAQLNFTIAENTQHEIKAYSPFVHKITMERVRDEFSKIIDSTSSDEGLRTLSDLGLLSGFIPELEQGIGVTQNRSHIYTVFEHNVHALACAAQRKYSSIIRMSALFHDIGKPLTKQGEGYNATFYNHDLVGGKMTRHILLRMKYPHDIVQKVSHLVRHHMFYYSIGQVTDAGVRRLLVRLGPENIADFLQLRICDRIGMGRPKAKPYKLTELERRLQEVQMDPLSPKMLAINGNDIMNILSIAPGPRIGMLTKALLAEVLDNPKLNTSEYLSARLEDLQKLSDADLRSRAPDIEKHERIRKAEFFKGYKEIQ